MLLKQTVLLIYIHPYPAKLFFLIFTHLKLCLATAIHNLKWVKNTHTRLIWDISFANPDTHTFCSQYHWFDRQIKQIKNDK